MSFVRFTLYSTICTRFQNFVYSAKNLVKFYLRLIINLVIIYAAEIFYNRRIYYLEIEHLYFDSVRMKAHGRIIAFDEGERILIVSFLGKSLSRVSWTSSKGIDRDAMRFQALGAILDWLAG